MTQPIPQNNTCTNRNTEQQQQQQQQKQKKTKKQQQQQQQKQKNKKNPQESFIPDLIGLSEFIFKLSLHSCFLFDAWL